MSFRGVDPGGAGGAVAPPMKILGGRTYHFAPPIISTIKKKNQLHIQLYYNAKHGENINIQPSKIAVIT